MLAVFGGILLFFAAALVFVWIISAIVERGRLSRIREQNRLERLEMTRLKAERELVQSMTEDEARLMGPGIESATYAEIANWLRAHRDARPAS